MSIATTPLPLKVGESQMRPQRRASAAAACLAAAITAVAAFGSGLDRLSGSDPYTVKRVPEMFRSQAWRGAAEVALAQRRVDDARGAAEAAVLTDPADPTAVSLLGLARMTAGDAEGAATAFHVSGALGWRDLPTQLYWLSVAPLTGDQAVAAERADAILRQDIRLLEQAQFLAELEATAAGRRALAFRLAARPPWFAEYWNRTFTLPPDRLAQRAAVLAEPALRRARIGCDEVRGLATRLIENRRASAARAVIGQHCAGGEHGASGQSSVP